MTTVAADHHLSPPVSESDDPEYAANLRRATLASTAVFLAILYSPLVLPRPQRPAVQVV